MSSTPSTSNGGSIGQMSVKAFLYAGSARVGEGEAEVRRFPVEEAAATNFEYLAGKVRQYFPQLQRKSFKLYWKDSDGDYISFSSDDELVEILTQMTAARADPLQDHPSQLLLRIFILPTERDSTPPPPPPPYSAATAGDSFADAGSAFAGAGSAFADAGRAFAGTNPVAFQGVVDMISQIFPQVSVDVLNAGGQQGREQDGRKGGQQGGEQDGRKEGQHGGQQQGRQQQGQQQQGQQQQGQQQQGQQQQGQQQGQQQQGQQQGQGQQEPSEEQRHSGVVCDGCEGAVVGIRYKCMSCPDFDLCASCFGKNIHSHHVMAAISQPRRFPWFGARARCGERRNHPYKEHDHGGHKHGHDHKHGHKHGHGHGGHKHGGHHHGHGNRHGRHHWNMFQDAAGNEHLQMQMQQFFTDLGECFGPPSDHAAAHAAASAAAQACAAQTAAHAAAQAAANATRGFQPERPQNEDPDYTMGDGMSSEEEAVEETGSDGAASNGAATHGAGPSTSGGAGNSGPNGGEDYLKFVGKSVAAILDPLGIDVVIDVETPSGRKNVVESMKKRKTEKTGEKNGEKTGKEKDDSKEGSKENSMETDADVVKVTEKVAELTTKDSETGQEASTSISSVETVTTSTTATSVAAAATAAPIVELPDDDDDVMIASKGGDDDWQMIGGAAAAPSSISAAAVTPVFSDDGAIPKRRSTSPEKQTPSMESASNIVPQTTTTTTTKDNPPHVAKSLEQMMSMGFSNDGNWLEQLLLAKDGNISMALDAINPAKPPSGHSHH